MGRDNQDERIPEHLSANNFPAASYAMPAASSSPGIRLGSLWVSYVESYYEASQKLFPANSKLVYPILYLQRHTFELLTKDILSTLLAIRDELHTLDALFGTLLGTGAVEPADFDAANSTHSFRDIFPRLERNLVLLGFPPLPKVFHEARQLFDGADDGQPERLRYATVFSKKKRTTQPSFPHELYATRTKYAPCDQIGGLLAQIMSARERQLDSQVNNRVSTEESELDEFYGRIWEACRESEYEIANALSPLVEATRSGQAVWRMVTSPRLDIVDHPDLMTVAESMVDQYAETTFRNRILTILTLHDVVTVTGGGTTTKRNGYYLAARRANGTLTQGVWPEDGQSNLIYEIGQAFKRASGTPPETAP